MTARPVIGEAEVKVVATLDPVGLRGPIDQATSLFREFTFEVESLLADGLGQAGESAGSALSLSIEEQLAQIALKFDQFGNQLKGTAADLRDELGIGLPELTPEQIARAEELSIIWSDLSQTASSGAFSQFRNELSVGVIPRVTELTDKIGSLKDNITELDSLSKDEAFFTLGLKDGELLNATRSLNAQLDQTKDLLDEATNVVVNRLTVAFIALSGAALFAFAQIETEMTNLFIRLPDLADEARGQIVASIRGIADEAEVGVRDAIGAAVLATRLGVPIEDFANLSAQVQDLGLVTGDYVGSIQAAVFAQSRFGDEAGDLEAIAGKLFVAWRDGGVAMGEVSRVMGQLSPLTSSVGVEFDEMLAILTRGGQSMLSASQVMTAMFTIIARLQNPTNELADAFRALGVESLPQAIRQFGGLVPFLVALQKHAAEAEVSFTKLIGGFRTSRVVMPLIADEGQGVIDIMESMGTGFEEVGRAAEDIEGTFAFAFGRLRDEMGETLQLLGGGLGPVVGIVVQQIENLNEALNKMGPLLSIVGSGIAGVTAVLVLNKFVFAIRHTNLLGRALGRLIPQLAGTSTGLKALQANLTRTTTTMKGTETGAASLTGVLIGLGLAVTIAAGTQVWLAFQKRNSQVKANVDELTASIIALNKAAVAEPETEAFFDLFQRRLIEDDDLDLLTRAGVSIHDLVEAAEEGPEAFLALKDSLQETLFAAQSEFGTNIFTRFLGESGVLSGEARDLDTKIGEFYDSVLLRQRIAADEAEVASQELAEALAGGEIVDSISEMDRIFGQMVPDDFYLSLRNLTFDIEELIDVYDRINLTAEQKIDSLLNTLMIRPIEQVDLNKEEMAAALAENARTIDIWLDTINRLSEEGHLRLAENLAQLGPEYTAAFQDLAGDNQLAAAAEGIINQVAGGWSPEEVAGTWGSAWEMVMADPQLQKILTVGGQKAIIDYLEGAIDWTTQPEVLEALKQAMGGMWTQAVDPTALAGIDLAKQGADAMVSVIKDILGLAEKGGSDEAEAQGPVIAINFASAIVQQLGAEGARLYNAGFGATQRVVEGANAGFAIRSPSGVGRGIGEDFVSGIWLGILDAAAKGAGRVGASVAKKISDGITLGLREQVQNLGGAFRTIFSMNRIQRAIDEAIGNINDLIERQEIGIPLEIEETQAALDEALQVGGEGIVTAAEQVGIEALEKKVKDLTLANKQGFASDAELAAAEDELNKVREDSVKKTDEVIQLEEDLIALNEELVSINEDIIRSLEDLNDMYIDAALAMFDVVDAIHDIESAGPEVLDSFRTMAEAAGIPEEAFDAMVATVEASMNAYKENIESTGVKIHFDPGRNATRTGGAGGGIAPKLDTTLQGGPIVIDVEWHTRGGWSVELTERSGRGQIEIVPVKLHLGGVLGADELGLVGERGPELIRGPATVIGTQATESMLRSERSLGGSGSTFNQISVPVEVGFPVSQTEARGIAETIRDAILDLEREDA